MGSGAFLVEACRLLAERLVRAWEVHKQTPKVPDDEDVLTYARRLVAERCLYGVDKNIFAVDLAKLSLWLATLARDHPFTFLDHALRHGDSLVGLSREQIACFNWETDEAAAAAARRSSTRAWPKRSALREQIQGLATSDDVPEKARLLQGSERGARRRAAASATSSSRRSSSARSRRTGKTLRVSATPGRSRRWLLRVARRVACDALAELRARSGDRTPVAFHWEIEFPEVFTRSNGGFDAFVGNPPFAGKNTITASSRAELPAVAARAP